MLRSRQALPRRCSKSPHQTWFVFRQGRSKHRASRQETKAQSNAENLPLCQTAQVFPAHQDALFLQSAFSSSARIPHRKNPLLGSFRSANGSPADGRQKSQAPQAKNSKANILTKVMTLVQHGQKMLLHSNYGLRQRKL